MKSCELNISLRFTKAAFLFGILGCLSFSSQVLATEISNANSTKHFADPFDGWLRASDSELEEQRGGFLLPNGINIDISIHKVISLNGIDTYSSYFQIPGNNFSLQIGDANIAPDLNNSTLASVIQNNLDDQIIRTINTINLEISNLHNINNLNDHSRTLTDQVMPNNIYH